MHRLTHLMLYVLKRENQKENPKFVPKFELNAIEENIRDPSEQICKELQSPRKVVRKK